MIPGKVYGAKARLNVWAPNVVGNDFSISQIWVFADVPNYGVNTVEAGWHVSWIQNIVKGSTIFKNLLIYSLCNGRLSQACTKVMTQDFSFTGL